jgi:hypothetical protein
MEEYKETCAVDVNGEDRWRQVTIVREDKNKYEGREACFVQELPAFMWFRIGVYEDGLDVIYALIENS